MTLPFLWGEMNDDDIYLRPLVIEDATDGVYPLWLNDAAVCEGNSHHVYPYTVEQAVEYIQYANNTKTDLILAIGVNEGGVHIGNIALQNIHPVYRTADFSILIGDQDYWHKGYGKAAARLIIDHGFMQMNLHRVACATFSNNIGMQKLALSLGMVQEGIRREAAYKNGTYLDILEYGILRKDWK